MNKIFSVAIIGCGNRGYSVYATKMKDFYSDKFVVKAVCDSYDKLLPKVAKHLGLDEKDCFSDEVEFFKEKRADILIIATQDRDHYRMAIKALELGYDILVEKPLTGNREECLSLLEAQKKYGGKVLVCHVLRYAPAFSKVTEILRSGVIGKLVCIESLEQVWYPHQAHSFVRGNWRRSDETSPMIIAKCCHDLDLLQFYANSKCVSVASMGGIAHFRPEEAPEGAAERCLDCKYVKTCPYSAEYVYIERHKMGRTPWASVVPYDKEYTIENLTEALKTGPYGRCVYHCDNNVVDHEQTIMNFENGVIATLTMTGFTAHGGRTMTFHGTHGELRLVEEREGYIEINIFGKEPEKIMLNDLNIRKDAHGGGDFGLIESLYEVMTGKGTPETSLEASIESHLMGIAAEESRLQGGKLVFVH